MPCFICEKCGSVDNTACGGNYWIHQVNTRTGSKNVTEKILCCECYRGKWHDRFPKKNWREYGSPEDLLKNEKEHPGGILNLEEYLKSIGEFPQLAVPFKGHDKRTVLNVRFFFCLKFFIPPRSGPLLHFNFVYVFFFSITISQTLHNYESYYLD